MQRMPYFSGINLSLNRSNKESSYTDIDRLLQEPEDQKLHVECMYRIAFFALRFTVSEKIVALVKCTSATYEGHSCGCLQSYRSCLLLFISFHIGRASFFPHKVIENQHNSKHLTRSDLHRSL